MKQKQFLLLLSIIMIGVSAFFLWQDWQPFVEEEAEEPLSWITMPVMELQQTESMQTAKETMQAVETALRTETETVTKRQTTTKLPEQIKAQQISECSARTGSACFCRLLSIGFEYCRYRGIGNITRYWLDFGTTDCILSGDGRRIF